MLLIYEKYIHPITAGLLSSHSDHLEAGGLTLDTLKPRAGESCFYGFPSVDSLAFALFQNFQWIFLLSLFFLFKCSCACLPELYPVLGHSAQKQPPSFCIPLSQAEDLTDSPTVSALLALGANLCRVCWRRLCILRAHWEYSGPMNI